MMLVPVVPFHPKGSQVASNIVSRVGVKDVSLTRQILGGVGAEGDSWRGHDGWRQELGKISGPHFCRGNGGELDRLGLILTAPLVISE